MENFPLLPRLQTIYLNNNHISKISTGISDCLPKLDTLILTNNRLVNLHDIDPLVEITSLTTLSLIDNVIAKKPHYRLYVIHKLPLLRLLDFKKIKAKVYLLHNQLSYLTIFPPLLPIFVLHESSRGFPFPLCFIHPSQLHNFFPCSPRSHHVLIYTYLGAC